MTVSVNVVVLAGTVVTDPSERRMPIGRGVHRDPSVRPRTRAAVAPCARRRLARGRREEVAEGTPPRRRGARAMP